MRSFGTCVFYCRRLFFMILKIYFLGRWATEGEQSHIGESKTDRDVQSTDWQPKWLSQPGLHQVNPGARKLCSRLPHEWQGSRCLHHHRCLPRHVNKKLHQKQSSRNLSRIPIMWDTSVASGGLTHCGKAPASEWLLNTDSVS